MNYCNLIPRIIIKNGKAFRKDDSTAYDAVELCEKFENDGADEVYIFEISSTDEEHETNIGIIKEIVAECDIQILLGGNVKRLEDVKKYLYAGAKMVILEDSKESNRELVNEASERFGADKVAVLFERKCSDEELCKAANFYFDEGATLFVVSDKLSDEAAKNFSEINIDLLLINDEITKEDIVKYCKVTNIYGFTSDAILSDTQEIMNIKQELKKDGVDVNVFESKMNYSEFKLNSDGLIPVVVQDYKTNEVLMLAYMNEEAFDNTIKTGRMTYYSRSRKELWIKGLTSGHYQYVKSLSIDCDNDTLLAKVKQIGAACHTGKRSCFYTELVKKEYDDTNPLMVFEDVFNVIKDRKVNPKEGSYTNYLFDKGIDKILKKVGEEATEIVIAAKNPDKEEIKYEISDFLYHVMVLMAEKEVSWEDITRELARR
ncbi:Phosphoribosyl-ATP pyrophosphatase [uncultured Eubacterium sp.]|jgi:phosphoribosyl-ATP pyrophosphohydrolase/phosphoribosyl-AMP cyclohydrolase|nr:bifunctional phosphoribosyl-AMP cyclohydrolase/phosphoribosyl-ATP diphosphatase HisIE [Bovifimicola ammoniilytica]MCU6753301.1 bifunctional phosphoribosyl-AMP cyclohydrolase/phosphoribosyl-ATP diphosphatase HisIE [Bovifimicola ammoniilytica]CCZ04426.1 phosphoribosyl-ATP diphosphatase [Eubacterium sp. CAG:603]SCJ59414.1 Phosphoribosyl-ATP pyrophosphatase [uncultured Eubacterium sp.]